MPSIASGWRKPYSGAAPGCDADRSAILICMRTTLNLRDDLVKDAMRFTGETEKTALIHRGLELLIQQGAMKELAALGGSDPAAEPIRRRRLPPAKPSRKGRRR